MRAPLRWTLTLLLAVLGALGTAPAHAASPSLSVSPPKAHAGGHVMLDFSTGDTQCDPQAGFTVNFTLDEDAIGQPAPLQANCHATEQVTIPLFAQCSANHLFEGTLYVNNQAQGSATHTFEVTCPKPTITIVPTHSATPSPTTSATPSPTASPTPSATPSPTPTPTPTKTLAPVVSASPVTAVSPPDFPTAGGGSRWPWFLGGGLLALIGLAVAVALVRPKTGTPVAAGTAVVSLLAGIGVMALAPSAPPKPVITGSYAVGPGEGCATGDIPVNGGFHDLGVPTDLLRFHPAGSSSDTGYWNVSLGTGDGSTVCLRLGRPVVWQVRDKALSQAAPSGAVSCQTDESLLGGGFAFPWGISGLSSYPQAPKRWVAGNAPYTDGPAPQATVDALCAQLPDGLTTYVQTASTPAAGIATAHCLSGDAVLNGGFSGAQVHGSYPIDGGWAAELGAGGGSAYAICTKTGKKLGVRSTSVASGEQVATCPGADTVLAGGWSGGADYDGLQHFEPEGSGWRAEKPAGSTTAYALCLRHY